MEHAVAALPRLTVPIVYATNNASRPPEEVAAHLTDLGLTYTGRDVATSSQAGAVALSGLLPPVRRSWRSGEPGVREALRQPASRC